MGQPSVPFQVPPIQSLPRLASSEPALTTSGVTTSGCAGREHEVARLEEAYRAAQNGTDRLVLVEGGRGVGKSRLLAELRGRVRLEGGVVLEGRCE